MSVLNIKAVIQLLTLFAFLHNIFYFFFKSLPPQVIYLDQISFIDRTAIDGRQAFCSTLNSTEAEQWKLEISNKYIYLYIYVHVCTFAVEEG